MKLGVLFSGGKDSVYACGMALKKESVSCLITLRSKNKESYMFHTPNVNLTELQSKACGIPIIEQYTDGEKETELSDLKTAIKLAQDKYKIEGVVTGAVMSVYQASRVQKICNELDLYCFNPLWYVDQKEYMTAIINEGYKVIFAGVFSYPFDETWLGKVIDSKILSRLELLASKYKITLTGEGGEFETFVCDAPFFKKRIVIDEAESFCRNNNGLYNITKAHLEEKCESESERVV